MKGKFLLLLLAACLGLSHQVRAQEEVQPVRIRAVLHDPLHMQADLFYPDPTGAILPLVFKPQDLSDPMFILPVNGTLVFYDKAAIDPENPAASLAASVKLPANLKQALAVVLPAPEGAKPAYRILLIEDSEKTFPGGESRAVSLVNTNIVIQAGEHKVPVEPGKITRIPAVSQVDDFHMAQTNFFYHQEETWVPFAERQLQYLKASRRLFIIHATLGALHPRVTTIVDTRANNRQP
jgi:hypothetical protein